MRWKILLSGPRMLRDLPKLGPQLERLDADLVLAESVEQQLDEDQLIELLGDVDAHICGGDTYTARVMDAAPRLKAIQKWGTGINAIDLEAAKERGIEVRNVPDAFSVPVSETVIGMMLTFARHIPWQDKLVRDGSWGRIDGTTLAESSLGIIGVGNIGQTLARRAAAFGMKLYGCDPKRMPLQLFDDTGIEMVERDELLSACDFVSLNCDLNPTSHHLIDDDAFALMRPNAVLINTSRGPVVSQDALVRALERRQIAGAAIDVFEQEPVRADNPLCAFDNVILSPHLANASDRACWRVHDIVIDNMCEMLDACGMQPGELRPTTAVGEPA